MAAEEEHGLSLLLEPTGRQAHAEELHPLRNNSASWAAAKIVLRIFFGDQQKTSFAHTGSCSTGS